MSSLKKSQTIQYDYDLEHYTIFTANGITNILIALTLFGIFLGIFYFTYAAKIEEKILNIQIQNLVDDMTGDIKNVFNAYPDQKEVIINAIKNLKIPDMSKEDKDVAENNRKIIKTAISAFSIFLGVVVAILVFLFFKYGTKMKNALIVNLILLVFIAVTEVVFLNVIAKNYMSLDPNKVKYTIISQLKPI
jgi:VIT1/CCC1 family predicted Fe2+/Mn2+ transporter